MEKTLQFYETFTWDMVRLQHVAVASFEFEYHCLSGFVCVSPQTVDNSLVTIPQLKYDVVDMLSKRSLRFKVCVASNCFDAACR